MNRLHTGLAIAAVVLLIALFAVSCESWRVLKWMELRQERTEADIDKIRAEVQDWHKDWEKHAR